MLALICVVFLSPAENLRHNVSVLSTLQGGLGVARDVDAVKLGKLLDQLALGHSVVNVHHTSSSSLQELNVRALEEGIKALSLLKSLPLKRKRLCKHTDNGCVGLGTSVVPSLQDNRLSLMRAQVMQSVAV